jgi:methylase of polypeptide subunit release factors
MPFKTLASTADEVNFLCNELLTPNVQEDNLIIDKTVTMRGIDIHYNDELHVGPLSFDPIFVELLDFLYPEHSFDNCLDWCCGAGFIGFSLFGKRIIDKLTLLDIYSPAITACDKTISGLNTDKIKTIQADSISKIEPENQYDLIVGNPPWMPQYVLFDDSGKMRRNTDPEFKIHHDFFRHARNYLTANGKIILLEGLFSSSPLDFKSVIEENGMIITKLIRSGGTGPYFIIIELNT